MGEGDRSMASCSLGRPLLAWFLTRLADLALGGLAVALVRGRVGALPQLHAQTNEGRRIGDFEQVRQLIGNRELFLHRASRPGLQGALRVSI